MTFDEKKKPGTESVPGSLLTELHGALNFAAAQATSANIDVLGGAVDNSLNTLDVGLHRTIGTSMGVGNIVTESHALAADIALCHLLHPLAVKIF